MVKVNKKYKDRLFCMVFNRKEELISLYNAISHSEYTDPEELEIYTLEDVIYMKMKNDLAFLIDDVLNLWEHQSTWNPNMPVRGTVFCIKGVCGIRGANQGMAESRCRSSGSNWRSNRLLHPGWDTGGIFVITQSGGVRGAADRV